MSPSKYNWENAFSKICANSAVVSSTKAGVNDPIASGFEVGVVINVGVAISEDDCLQNEYRYMQTSLSNCGPVAVFIIMRTRTRGSEKSR